MRTNRTSSRSLPYLTYYVKDPPNSSQGHEIKDKRKDDSSIRKVSFHQIEVREYEQIICDNPSVTSGPPLGLGWAYNEAKCFNIDEYEKMRRRAYIPGKQLKISKERREERLKQNWAYSTRDIQIMVKNVNIARRKQRQTVSNMEITEQIFDLIKMPRRHLFVNAEEKRLRKILRETEMIVKEKNLLQKEMKESSSSSPLDLKRGFNDEFFKLYHSLKQHASCSISDESSYNGTVQDESEN